MDNAAKVEMSRLEEYQINLIMSMSQKKIGEDPFPISAIEDFCRDHWPEKQIRKPLIELIIKVRRNNHIPAAVHHSTCLFKPKVVADFSPAPATSRPPTTMKLENQETHSPIASYLQNSSPSEYQHDAVSKLLAHSLDESRPGSSSISSSTTDIKTLNHEIGLTPYQLKSEITEGMPTKKPLPAMKHKEVFLAELTGFTISELYIGRHATPFTLHTRLLCENSGFFARLLCNPTTTQDRCFIGVDPKTFAAVFDWLYRGKLPDITVNDPEVVHRELLYRMNVYTLADQLDMPAFKDAIMTDVMRGFMVNSMLPDDKEIEFAYEMTAPNSTLRQYIARMFQFMLYIPDTPAVGNRWYSNFTTNELKAFLSTHADLRKDVFNMIKALGDTDEQELAELLDPRLVFVCDFHEHANGHGDCQLVGYTAGFFSQ